MIGQLVVVWKQYLIYLLTSLSPVLYRGSGGKTSRRKRGEKLRTSKRKAPAGSEQEQIESLQKSVHYLWITNIIVNIAIILLTFRVFIFINTTGNIFYRIVLILQQLSQLLN